MNFEISEIQIIPVKPNNGLVAFASCVINGSLYLGSIAIHKKLNDEGYRLTYPTKKIGDTNVNIYHPIQKDASKIIETAILTQYSKLAF